MTLLKSSEKLKVLLLEGVHPGAVKHIEKSGLYVEMENHSLAETELIHRAQGFHAIGIRSKTQINQKVLSELKDLQVIGAFCIGTNQINLDAANIMGVPAFNAPYSNTRSVAELVIGEMIALSRKLGDINNKAHSGQWQKSASGSHELRGKTLGVVGYGHIGSQLSILAESMGLNVLYYDVVKKLPLGNAQSVESLEELLRHSDFVSFHVPETPMTKDMVGTEEFNQMREGAYLINASRGTVVQIQALVEALKSKKLAGAAIDVFPIEPASNQEEFKSELRGLDNVILTPHIGGSTEEAQEAIGLEVSESIIRYLQMGSSFGAVNFPTLDVPQIVDHNVIRITNVHKNVPGVLSDINHIATDVGANIKRQYLSTDREIGYLVMDIEKGQVMKAAEQINDLKTSIKTRIL